MTSRTATTTILRHLSRLSNPRTTFHPPLRPASLSCPSCQRTYFPSSTATPSRPQLRMPSPRLHRTVFIQTLPTPNDHALKFVPTEHALLPPSSPTVEFLSTSPSVPSPLARSLLAIPGVRSVMFSPEFLTVEKEEDAQWAHIKPEVFSVTMEHLLSGTATLEGGGGAEDTRVREGDSETVQMIKELLETRIRPAIMEDGGDIEYRGFSDEGEVLLKLRGACRTCDSSVVTLKNGIEAMMKHYIPEVVSVRQVMDDEEEIALKEFEKLEAKLAAAKGPEAVSETGDSRV